MISHLSNARKLRDLELRLDLRKQELETAHADIADIERELAKLRASIGLPANDNVPTEAKS